MIDFENIEEKFKIATESKSWKALVSDFLKCKKVYLIGNGGLHFTAAHGATDCTRLIPGKLVISFDSNGYITSCANDHGFENLFVRCLETSGSTDDPSTSMVIGLSCSGNSKNITRALSWAKATGYKSAMITGQESKRLEKGINEVVLDCKYFHTCEVLTLILFYQLIHESGHSCPAIIDEIKRKDPWALGKNEKK
jgi:D-sedoheptulose 7-phosphate isomerase